MSILDIFKQRRVTPLQRLIIDRSDNKSVSAAAKKLLELAAFLIPIKPRMSKSYVERFYNDRTIIEFAIFFYMHFELHLIAILDENFRVNADKVKKDYIDVFSKIQPSINFEELMKDRLILYHKKCAEARYFFDETIKTFCLLVFETQDQKKFSLHADDFIMFSLNPIDNILFEKHVSDYLDSLDKVGKLDFVKLKATTGSNRTKYQAEKLNGINKRNQITRYLSDNELKEIPNLLGRDAYYLYCDYLDVSTVKGITYYSSNSFSIYYEILDRFYGRYIEEEGFFNFQLKRFPINDAANNTNYAFNKIEVTYTHQNEKYFKLSESEDTLIRLPSSAIQFDGGRITKIELFEVNDVSVIWGDNEIVRHDSDLLFTLSNGRKFLLGTKWYHDSKLFFTNDSKSIKTHLKTRKKRLEWKR